MSIMKTMSGLEGELRYSVQHRIIFEGALVSACLGVDGGESLADLQARIARIEKTIAGQSRSGFNSAPVIKDARQVWLHLASELKKRKYNVLALAMQDAKFELDDNEFRISITDGATYKMVSEKSNRDVINEAFKADSITDGLRLVINEIKHIDEDKAVPYLREMFGNTIEIV